jgi:hypothetical protein
MSTRQSSSARSVNGTTTTKAGNQPESVVTESGRERHDEPTTNNQQPTTNKQNKRQTLFVYTIFGAETPPGLLFE